MHFRFKYILFLIYILNKSYIYAFNYQSKKISPNINTFFNRYLNLRSFSNKNINNKISTNSNKEGLYYFDINIGTPFQQFSVLIDTGSNFFFINNNKCKGCNSKNGFITTESKTYNSINKFININYISGGVSGVISNDLIKINDNNILNLSFFLINESNIDLEFDGIFGLSKNIKDINNTIYSPLNQLFHDNFFLLDFPHHSFYISEIPSYFNNIKYFSCPRKSIYNLNNFYWKCMSEKVEFKNNYNSNIIMNNNIIFDSGINFVVLSLNYISFFQSVLDNNKILSKAKCEIRKSAENKFIYQLFCDNINNLILEEKIEDKEDFINIFFDNKNSISFGLNDLYDKDKNVWKLYFIPLVNNTIILGIPFFEKYPILLSKDNDEIIIFNEQKNILEHKLNNKSNINIILNVFIIIIIILFILLIYRIYKKRKNNQYNSINFEKQFSTYG